jgi:hypothetical protein
LTLKNRLTLSAAMSTVLTSMETYRLIALSALTCLIAGLVGCRTPAGTGAAAGAATGAVVGGPVGAAGGAIIGAVVGEAEATNYGPVPKAGYPVATPAGQPGMVRSPYTGRLYDVRAVPHGALVRDVDANKLFRRP